MIILVQSVSRVFPFSVRLVIMTTTVAMMLLLSAEKGSGFVFHPSQSSCIIHRHTTKTSPFFYQRSRIIHSFQQGIEIVSSSLSAAANDDEHDDQHKQIDNKDEPASYLATCIPGLAHVLAEELQEIHHEITDVRVSGNAAVTFAATRYASLAALCWCRTAHRLLELITTTSDTNTYLYDRDDLHAYLANEVDVKSLLGDGQGGLLTLSVKTILNNPRELPKDLSHSHYTALTIKNALCDVVRNLRGDRPSVDVENPDVPLVAMLLGSNGAAVLSLYRSLHPPGSLHKRGYRQGGAIHKAAMKESLAAGLLREAGWNKRLEVAKKNNDDQERLRLIDPMCGSGTFIVEGAMMAANIAPGLMRIRCNVDFQKLPPVTRWKSNVDSEKMWKEILLDASQLAKTGLQWIRRQEPKSKLQMIANDIHSGALDLVDQALFNAGLQNLVEITNMDCYDLEITLAEDEKERDVTPRYHNLIVTNPPWGIRLTEDITDSWEGLKHFIRDACPASGSGNDKTEVWVLSGHKAATGLLKLRRDRMIPLQTGDQTLRWIQYTIRGKNDDSPVRDDMHSATKTMKSSSSHRGWGGPENSPKDQQQRSNVNPVRKFRVTNTKDTSSDTTKTEKKSTMLKNDSWD